MTNNFGTMAWDADVDAAVISLNRTNIKDHTYWFNTVDIVEQGYDPKSRKSITLESLRAWVDRCKQAPDPDEEDETHEPSSNTRYIRPTDRVLCDQ